MDLKVKISRHKTLNQVKGVIRSPRLLTESVSDLEEMLKGQKVAIVERMKRMEDGKLVETDTHILTFDMYQLPQTVKVAYLNLPVRMYFPRPMRCKKCQLLGHTKKSCKREKEVCCLCAQDIPCEPCGPARCANCSGPHSSDSRDCPRFQEEKSIISLQVKNRLSYWQAKREWNQKIQHANQQQNFSQVVQAAQNQQRAVNQNQDPEFIQAKTEIQALKQQMAEVMDLFASKDELIQRQATIIQQLESESEQLKRRIAELERNNPSDAVTAMDTSPVPKPSDDDDAASKKLPDESTEDNFQKPPPSNERGRDKNRQNTDSNRSRSNSRSSGKSKRKMLINSKREPNLDPEVKAELDALKKKHQLEGKKFSYFLDKTDSTISCKEVSGGVADGTRSQSKKRTEYADHDPPGSEHQ